MIGFSTRSMTVSASHFKTHLSVYLGSSQGKDCAVVCYGNVSVPDVFRLQKWIRCLCWCVCCIYEKERWFPGPVESQLLSRTSLSLCWMWWRELYSSVSHALALELTVKYVLHDGWLLCLYASPLVELLLEFCCSSHSYICRFSSGNFTPALFLTYSLQCVQFVLVSSVSERLGVLCVWICVYISMAVLHSKLWIQ